LSAEFETWDRATLEYFALVSHERLTNQDELIEQLQADLQLTLRAWRLSLKDTDARVR
jgi:hypothetical protein